VIETGQMAEVHGMVVALDDVVATIEMGDDREEWVFPRTMLPHDIDLDSVLVFEGSGTDAVVIDHRPPGPSVEDRLNRALIRRGRVPS
jgi:hypothetical protein